MAVSSADVGRLLYGGILAVSARYDAVTTTTTTSAPLTQAFAAYNAYRQAMVRASVADTLYQNDDPLVARLADLHDGAGAVLLDILAEDETIVIADVKHEGRKLDLSDMSET